MKTYIYSFLKLSLLCAFFSSEMLVPTAEAGGALISDSLTVEKIEIIPAKHDYFRIEFINTLGRKLVVDNKTGDEVLIRSDVTNEEYHVGKNSSLELRCESSLNWISMTVQFYSDKKKESEYETQAACGDILRLSGTQYPM